MYRLHFQDGSSLSFNPGSSSDALLLLDILRDPRKQALITACAVATDQNIITVARPKGYGVARYLPELIERAGKRCHKLHLYFGENALLVSVHESEPSIRIAVARQGVQRYNPTLDGGTTT